jgi:hypothetical protein
MSEKNNDSPGWFWIGFLLILLLALISASNKQRYEIRHHRHVGDSVVVDPR